MSGFLELDAAPDFVAKKKSGGSGGNGLTNGAVVKCTRTWKYETYIVEVGDLGEIVNEVPDEEGEVVVRWKTQGKQGYIKPSALEPLAATTAPSARKTTAKPRPTPTSQAGALPPELQGGAGSTGIGLRSGPNTGGVGGGVTGNFLRRGAGGRVAIAKGRPTTKGESKAELAARKQLERLKSLNLDDDTPDLFPDDDDAPSPKPTSQTMSAYTHSPNMESNPDADEKDPPVTLTFQPGRIGIRYMGNIITKVTAATQAASLGVRFGWRITQINSQPIPYNLKIPNAQKCVDVFLAQQKAAKTSYTITFQPTNTRILVVGAGCEVVNGCYEEFGTHHGKPRFKKVGGGIYIWWDKHSYWNMVNQVDFVKYKQNGGSKKSCYYGIQSDEKYPPCEGWMRSHLGSNPLPVLVTDITK